MDKWCIEPVPHPTLLTLEQKGLRGSLAIILNHDNEKGVIHTAVQNSVCLLDAIQMKWFQNLLQFQEAEKDQTCHLQ